MYLRLSRFQPALKMPTTAHLPHRQPWPPLFSPPVPRSPRPMRSQGMPTSSVSTRYKAWSSPTEDTLWAATTGGAVRWNLATGSHVQMTAADGLAANWVNDVAWTPDGSLWFATLGGVSCLSGDGWTTYTAADGLVDDAVQAIAVSEDGTIWAGTMEGISRFDGTTWMTHFPGDRAWQIDVGPDGAVWFACDAADLRRYTPASDTWETFVMADDPTAPGAPIWRPARIARGTPSMPKMVWRPMSSRL